MVTRLLGFLGSGTLGWQNSSQKLIFGFLLVFKQQLTKTCFEIVLNRSDMKHHNRGPQIVSQVQGRRPIQNSWLSSTHISSFSKVMKSLVNLSTVQWYSTKDLVRKHWFCILICVASNVVKLKSFENKCINV